jgi:hypothetical protein
MALLKIKISINKLLHFYIFIFNLHINIKLFHH